MVLGSARTG